jgi:hypothetical protein
MRSHKPHSVVLAKAGTHCRFPQKMDSRFRGNDVVILNFLPEIILCKS